MPLDITPMRIPEERLPEQALVRFGSSLLRADISGILSPSGEFFACPRRISDASSGLDKDPVVVCDSTTGRIAGHFAYDATALCLAFVPGRQQLVVGYHNGFLVVWDFAGGEKVCEMRHEQGERILRLAVSSDGRILASASRTSLILWDLPKGKEIRQLNTESPTAGLAFVPDRTTLFVGDHAGALSFVEVPSGRKTKQLELFTPRKNDVLPLPKHAVFSLVCSRDGTRAVARSLDGELVLFALDGGKELLRTKPLRRGGRALRFTPDAAMLVMAGPDNTLLCWDAKTGAEKETLPPSPDLPWDVAFSADGKTMVSLGTLVQRWDLSTGRELSPQNHHRQSVSALVCCPRAQLLATGSSDGTVRLWHVDIGAPIALLEDTMGLVFDLTFFAAGTRLVSASDDGILRLWDEKGTRIARLAGHRGAVVALAVTSDDRTLLSGGVDAIIRCWDLQTREVKRTLVGHTHVVVRLAITPDNTTAASLDEAGKLRLWDLTTGKELPWATPDDKRIRAFTFSPDGKYLVASLSGTRDLWLWEMTSGRLAAIVKMVDRVGSRYLAFLSERALVVADGKRAVLLDLATRQCECIRDFERDFGRLRFVSSIAVQPGQPRLFTGHWDGSAYSWDLRPTLAQLARTQPRTARRNLLEVWKWLGQPDPQEAFPLLWGLVEGETETVNLLKQQLRPTPAVAEKDILPHLARLDNEDFATRQRAFTSLLQHGEAALPLLRKRLADSPSPEAKANLERLIAGAEELTPERLQALRAVQVLEYIATPAALAVLTNLSKGLPESRLTKDATAALQRLEAKKKGPR
jgi:WD40 repeat protein